MPWPWSAKDQGVVHKEPDAPIPPSRTHGSWDSVLNTNYTWQQNAVISAASIASFIALARLYKRFLRRIPTIDHLSPATFGKRSIYGYVTRVGDGDNFHLFHAPGGRMLGWNWLPGRKISALTGKELQGNTVHVRIAGVDAPEMAHFGRPAQPFGREALDWLKAYLLGRWVRAIPYSRDRFDRVVCTVQRRRFLFFNSDVGLAMLKQGIATVYEAKTGSEFGGMEEQYRAAEAKAKRKNVGMWNQKSFVGRLLGGQAAVETPRQYKTRYRQEDQAAADKAAGVVGSVLSTSAEATKTVAAKAASAAKSVVTTTTETKASHESTHLPKHQKGK